VRFTIAGPDAMKIADALRQVEEDLKAGGLYPGRRVPS
jgi:hypothetical protein